jgi:glycosyltransferase involved in cell wall biosynthesis
VIPFFFAYQIILIKKIIKRENIKIIHAYWIIPGAFLAAIYRRFFNKKVKIIVTLLGADVWSFNKGWKKYLLKFTFNYIDIVTTQSPQLGQELLELGFKGKIFHYPIGIDITKFSPDRIDTNIKEKYDIKGEMLLFVGSLIDRKGIKYLISAMPHVLEKFPETKLIIIGSGNLQESMSMLTKDLNLINQIVFTGNILNHNLPPYFATADIFILPSLSEGFPLVVMEALSSGTISIVSDLPVFKNLEINSEFLVTVEKRDSIKIANAIIKVLSQKDALNEAKKEARNYALENFDNKKSAINYSSAYELLLNHK